MSAQNGHNQTNGTTSPGTDVVKIGDKVVVTYANYEPVVRRCMMCRTNRELFLRVHNDNEADFSDDKFFDDQWFYPEKDEWEKFDPTKYAHHEAADRSKEWNRFFAVKPKVNSACNWVGLIFSEAGEKFVVVSVRSRTDNACDVDYVSLKYFRENRLAADEQIFFGPIDAARIVQSLEKKRITFERPATKDEICYARRCAYANNLASTRALIESAVRQKEEFSSRFREMEKTYAAATEPYRQWIAAAETESALHWFERTQELVRRRQLPKNFEASVASRARIKVRLQKMDADLAKAMRDAATRNEEPFCDFMRQGKDIFAQDPRSAVRGAVPVVSSTLNTDSPTSSATKTDSAASSTRTHRKRSEFVGVTWNEPTKKWKACIYADGKRKYLGSFAAENDAARAYDAAAALASKPLNFPGAGQAKAVKAKRRSPPHTATTESRQAKQLKLSVHAAAAPASKPLNFPGARQTQAVKAKRRSRPHAATTERRQTKQRKLSVQAREATRVWHMRGAAVNTHFGGLNKNARGGPTKDVFVHAVQVRALMRPKRFDDRAIDAVQCNKCKSAFSFMRGRYMCKFCGKAHCWKCLDKIIDDERSCSSCHAVYVNPPIVKLPGLVKERFSTGNRVMHPKPPSVASKIPRVNSFCFVDYYGQGQLKRGRIVAVVNGRCSVQYDNGDIETNVPFSRIKTHPHTPGVKDDDGVRWRSSATNGTPRLNPGQRVNVRCNGFWKRGKIVNVASNGFVDVEYDDGESEFSVRPARMQLSLSSSSLVEAPWPATTNSTHSSATARVVDSRASAPSFTGSFRAGDPVDVNLGGLVCVGARVRMRASLDGIATVGRVVARNRQNDIVSVRVSVGTTTSPTFVTREVNLIDVEADRDEDQWTSGYVTRVRTSDDPSRPALIWYRLSEIHSPEPLGPLDPGRFRPSSNVPPSTKVADAKIDDDDDDESQSTKTAPGLSVKIADADDLPLFVNYEGNLYKRSRSGGSFRLRFFQLRYGALYWYYDRSSELWKGVCWLDGYKIRQSRKQERDLQFDLIPPASSSSKSSRGARKLELQSRSREEMRVWIEHLQRTIRRCALETGNRDASTGVPRSPFRLRTLRQQSRIHLTRLENRRVWVGWLPSPNLPEILDENRAPPLPVPGDRVRVLWVPITRKKLEPAHRERNPVKGAGQQRAWYGGTVRAPPDGSPKSTLLVRYDDGDVGCYEDISKIYWKPEGRTKRKDDVGAKVIFSVSWSDYHGKRFPSTPQKLHVAVDRSAVSRLVICAIGCGDIAREPDAIRSLYLDAAGLLSASWAAGPMLHTTDVLPLDNGSIMNRTSKRSEIWAHGVLLANLTHQLRALGDLKKKDISITFDAVKVTESLGKMLVGDGDNGATMDDRLRFFAFMGQAFATFNRHDKGSEGDDKKDASKVYFQSSNAVPDIVWDAFTRPWNERDARSRDDLRDWKSDTIAANYVKSGLRLLMNASFRLCNYKFVRAAPLLMQWDAVAAVPRAPIPTPQQLEADDRMSSAFADELRMLCAALESPAPKRLALDVQLQALVINAPTLGALEPLLKYVMGRNPLCCTCLAREPMLKRLERQLWAPVAEVPGLARKEITLLTSLLRAFAGQHHAAAYPSFDGDEKKNDERASSPSAWMIRLGAAVLDNDAFVASSGDLKLGPEFDPATVVAPFLDALERCVVDRPRDAWVGRAMRWAHSVACAHSPGARRMEDGPLIPSGIASNVKTVRDNQMTSSSQYNTSCRAALARLHMGRVEGWCPYPLRKARDREWLQIDLKKECDICAVQTQGNATRSEWTTEYRLLT
eukprot:g3043.t1